jgi:lysophospholipase L1-like esterase
MADPPKDVPSDVSRRDFVVTTGGVLGLSFWPPRAGSPAHGPVAAGSVILFQGDSITDCRRDRGDPEPNHAAALATGYPLLIAAELLRARPEAGLRIFNRGVSGNTVPDLDARWQTDALDLKPDLLSILIGVNDIWHKLHGTFDGTVESYEAGYDALLTRTKRALPGVRLVVMEPFALRTGAVPDAWFPEFDARRAVAARVAERASATFVPLHNLFERLSREAPPEYWAADGVHPTVAGHAVIARAWLETVRP